MLYQMEPRPVDFIQQSSVSMYVDGVYRQYISELLIKIIIIITMEKTVTIRTGEEEEKEKVESLPHQKC